MEVISSKQTEARIEARRAKMVAESNAAIWAETYLRNEFGEPFSFVDRVYQIEPMTLSHPCVACRKGTQGGWTLAFIIRMAFGMIRGEIPRGVIELFPTDDKVSDFSQRRWTPFLDQNRWLLSQYMKSTANVHTKRIGTANLMFIGGQLPHTIQGVDAQSIALTSDPADVIVYEERDLIPEYAIGKARGRLAASRLGWEWSLANPTVPKYGIDALWEAGDQRHWSMRCSACNEWNFPDIEFPNCLMQEPGGEVYLGCIRCRAKLNPRIGRWVPKFPERSKDAISYWSSQLHSVSPACHPRVILAEYNHPPQNNLGDVIKLRLGRPYLDAQYGMTADDVLLRCGTEPQAAASSIPTAMGVDVGAALHVVLGLRLTNDAYRVLACLLVSGWDELKLVANAYNVEVSSLDNEPEIHKAREYQATGRGRIWLSDYTTSVAPYHYDEKTGVITANRTQILDETHFYIMTPGRLVLPAVNTNVKIFAEHCAAMVKIVVKNPRTGAQDAMYRPRGDKPDHFRHAFANFLLAARQQVPVEYRRTHPRSNTPRRTGFNLYE
jgi:hypothetical protein